MRFVLLCTDTPQTFWCNEWKMLCLENSKHAVVCMGVGRGGGACPPGFWNLISLVSGFRSLKFDFFSKKRSHRWEWVKWNLTIVGRTWKNLFGYPRKNPLLPSPWKKSFLRPWWYVIVDMDHFSKVRLFSLKTD